MAGYSRTEVRSLLKRWDSLERTVGSFDHMRRADLSLAMPLLTPKQYHAILLHLMLGYTQDDTAWALGIHQTSVSERVENGIKRITDHLNGDDN